MENIQDSILKLCQQGKGKKAIATATGISVDKAKTYVKNYKNETFNEYVNATTGEVIITTIKPKQLYVNVLKYFECIDVSRIIETLSEINIKISRRTIENYKKNDLIIPSNIEKYKYIKDIYNNCMGFNKKGFIGKGRFFGSHKDTIAQYYGGIYRLAKLIQKDGEEATYKNEIKNIKDIDLFNFFSYFLFPIAKVVAHNDLKKLYKVDYIYYSTNGYKELTKEQKIYLQKQKEEGKIMLNKTYIIDNDEDDWGDEFSKGDFSLGENNVFACVEDEKELEEGKVYNCMEKENEEVLEVEKSTIAKKEGKIEGKKEVSAVEFVLNIEKKRKENLNKEIEENKHKSILDIIKESKKADNYDDLENDDIINEGEDE